MPKKIKQGRQKQGQYKHKCYLGSAAVVLAELALYKGKYEGIKKAL